MLAPNETDEITYMTAKSFQSQARKYVATHEYTEYQTEPRRLSGISRSFYGHRTIDYQSYREK